MAGPRYTASATVVADSEAAICLYQFSLSSAAAAVAAVAPAGVHVCAVCRASVARRETQF